VYSDHAEPARDAKTNLYHRPDMIGDLRSFVLNYASFPITLRFWLRF